MGTIRFPIQVNWKVIQTLILRLGMSATLSLPTTKKTLPIFKITKVSLPTHPPPMTSTITSLENTEKLLPRVQEPFLRIIFQLNIKHKQIGLKELWCTNYAPKKSWYYKCIQTLLSSPRLVTQLATRHSHLCSRNHTASFLLNEITWRHVYANNENIHCRLSQ